MPEAFGTDRKQLGKARAELPLPPPFRRPLHSTQDLGRSELRSDPPQPAEASDPAPLANGLGICVLVIEDNTDVGTFATQILAELGYRTGLAVGAEEALAELVKDALSSLAIGRSVPLTIAPKSQSSLAVG